MKRPFAIRWCSNGSPAPICAESKHFSARVPARRSADLTGHTEIQSSSRGMSFPSAFLASVLVLLLASTLRAQVPPDAEWRTFETAHFRVNFIAGLDSLAFRAA